MRPNNAMDPSEWMKPKQQRPIRRSLYAALRKESNVKCLILTALIYGCIVAIIWCRVTRVTKVDIDFTAFPITSTREISPCDDGSIYIPTAFVVMLYLLYLVECWHCKAWLQLKFEKTDLNSAYQKIHEIRHAQPVVWWKAICYHYVRRTREITRYRNGNAYTCTQVYYERVNSHVAAGCFFFALCGMKDVSRELIDLEKHAATKIQLSKGFLFANLATAKEFQEQRAAFFQEQERYDDYMEMREGMDLSNVHFKESLISWASPDNPPWFAKIPVFWLCNLLLLSWPLRLILELNTAHLHYQVNKLFGVNYMSPSGSELLLSAPRTHGLPINNQQHRIHNRAISSHHSRLNPRRRSLVASEPSSEQEESAPLLSNNDQSPNQFFTNNQGNISEKDPNELQNSSKNLHKDQQPHQNNTNSNSNNVVANTSPSSSSGGIFFPQWRSSFFSRNFRFTSKQSGYKLTRSVTLLMTKPEKLQFLASTQPRQFPDQFGYYGESDEGSRLLHDESYYPPCSSPPPPPFLTPSPEEDEEDECDECEQNSGNENERSSRRLINHHPQRSLPVTRNSNSSNQDRDTNFGGISNYSLAPSYSQALLLMEPSEREQCVVEASSRTQNANINNHSLHPLSSSPHPPPPASCDYENRRNSVCDLGLHANLTNDQRDPNECMLAIAGNGNSRRDTMLAAEFQSPLAPAVTGGGQIPPNGAHHSHHPNHCNNWPAGTAWDGHHNATQHGSGNEATSGDISDHHSQSQDPCFGSGPPNGHAENDLCFPQETCSSEARGQRQFLHEAPAQTSSSFSVSSSSHYHLASARLASAGSSLVLNTVAPREMTGVQIDLTQPIVVTVPRDPLRESSTSRVVASTNSANGNNVGFRDDQPPSYFEALRTSRPVFLPALARIRRCFTERDIASRFSSNRVWLDEIADGRDHCEGGCNFTNAGGNTTSRV